MPRTTTGGLISRGPDSLQLTRPVTEIFDFFYSHNFPVASLKKKKKEEESSNTIMTRLPGHMIQAVTQESNSPEDDFLLFD